MGRVKGYYQGVANKKMAVSLNYPWLHEYYVERTKVLYDKKANAKLRSFSLRQIVQEVNSLGLTLFMQKKVGLDFCFLFTCF